MGMRLLAASASAGVYYLYYSHRSLAFGLSTSKIDPRGSRSAVATGFTSSFITSPMHMGPVMWASQNVLVDCDLPPEARRRRRLRSLIRPRSVLNMSILSQRGDNLEGDIEQQMDAVTTVESAEVTGTGSSNSNRNSNFDGDIEQSGGIGWSTLASVVATQASFLCILWFVAGPTIRERVASSVEISFPSVGLGVLAATPLLIIGLALKTRNWAWVKKVDEITMHVTAQLFGTERQVIKVLALTIPLASFIGLAEEFTFRGVLPLILAGMTGLPTATVIGLSALIFGVLHAASVAYFVNASLCGVYFHCLLLSTGNIAVPIVAHAVYDAFALFFCHLKATSQSE